MDFTKCVTLVGALLLLGACLPADACSCMFIDHPQGSFCSSNAAMKVKFIKESNEAPKNPSSAAKFGYAIEVLQVLNGDAALQKLTYIGTPPSSASCQYEHSKTGYGVPYLVVGYITDGNVMVGSCSFVRPWSALTANQIRGLERAYEPGCGTCGQITKCYSPPCDSTKGCILENDDQTKNQACLPNGSTCAWKAI